MEIALEQLSAKNDEAVRLRDEVDEEHGRYRALFEDAPTCFLVTDSIGVIREANHRAALLLGAKTESLIGETVLSFVQQDDREGLRVRLYEIAKEQVTRYWEATLGPRDDHGVPCAFEVAPFRDPRSPGPGLRWVITDISAQQQARTAMQNALDRERNAAHRLKELDEFKNAMLVAVSHELRTPLAAILGFAQVLERYRDLDSDQASELLHRLVVNAQNLDRLLGDLLDLERLRRGIMKPRFARIALSMVVRDAVAAMDVAGRSVQIEAPSVWIDADEARVRRVVENLVANAFKYAPGSPVWIRVVPEQGGAIISVDDTGPGVADDLKKTIFLPFERGKVPSTAPGTGIGLSLVRRFAAMHGGRAWVQDRPGGGASFRVFLPARASDPVVETATDDTSDA
ncbi:MAG: PAS domain-containing sensor histidine kinase [Actinomycetota bacterium]